MAHSTRLDWETDPARWASPDSRAGDDRQLRELLKHCDLATYVAACEFRKIARPEHLRVIVVGVIRGYVDPEFRARLAEPTDDLRLAEDLGLDSLTLMEIAIRLEDVLQIAIRDDEPRHFRTLGDVQSAIERIVAKDTPGIPPSPPAAW